MLKGKQFAARVMVALLVWLLPLQWAEAGSPARSVVERLDSRLLEVMRKADALGFRGRHARLEPVLRQTFDLPYITRLVSGRHWKGWSDGQRAKMVEAFSRLTFATYADRFDGYDGERFKITAERPLKKQRVFVRCQLTKPNGEAIQLDYVLHKAADRWRIINVVADGISDLSLRRAEYTAVIKRDGFDALITQLNNKIVVYAREE